MLVTFLCCTRFTDPTFVRFGFDQQYKVGNIHLSLVFSIVTKSSTIAYHLTVLNAFSHYCGWNLLFNTLLWAEFLTPQPCEKLG